MSEDQASAAASGTATGGGGSVINGLIDQIIDAHEQVYTMVSSVLTGGVMDSSTDSSTDTTGAGRTNMPPANDAPLFDGTPEEMMDLSAEEIEEMINAKSPLEGMAEQVMGDIFQGQMGPQTPMEHLQAFRAAIDWTEPLIVGLLIFQLVMFACTVMVIKRSGTASRLGLLVFIAIVVRLAERINAYAGARWEDIATQNYFDTHGIFVLIFLAVPLLLDCVLMLVSFMREASSLLVEVKTRELKEKGREKKAAKGNAGESGGKSAKKTSRGKRSKKLD